MDFEFKERYNINDLIKIVKLLRAPGGCPWDREQTHESIKKNFIEETYEVIEAINKSDKKLLEEELGDVLLQVALHSEMEDELSTFNFDDVANGICQKLIIRHPHVFGDLSAKNTDEALTNWDAIKAKTKGQTTKTESMQSIPMELPALMRAQKVQHKASKVGFDWKSIDGAYSKLDEEINELKMAVSKNDQKNIDEELGDVLFSVVNIARFVKADSEESLTLSTNKFIERFSLVEKMASEKNIDMSSCSLDVLDSLWNDAKKTLSN